MGQKVGKYWATQPCCTVMERFDCLCGGYKRGDLVTHCALIIVGCLFVCVPTINYA